MRRKISIGVLLWSLVFACGCAGQKVENDSAGDVTSSETVVAQEASVDVEATGEVLSDDKSVPQELISVSEKAWDAVETREYEVAQSLFEEIVSKCDVNLGNKSDEFVFVNAYDSIENLAIDAYAGMGEITYFTKGQQAAAEFMQELYEEIQDDRLHMLAEMFYIDGEKTNYTHGYVSDDFIKEECTKVLPVLLGKIEKHGEEHARLVGFWNRTLAYCYYMLEDFETYIDIYYEGQDIDEMEPVELVTGDETAINLENIHYGLRWNEEKEEYETFTLDRFWGYSEKKGKKIVYCDTTGRFIKESFSYDASSTVEEYSYDDNGRLILNKSVSSNPGLEDDICVTTYVWREYDENNDPPISWINEKETPFYVLERHLESNKGEPYDGVDYLTKYGEFYSE